MQPSDGLDSRQRSGWSSHIRAQRRSYSYRPVQSKLLCEAHPNAAGRK
jgi:hypothetical protein